MPKMSKSAKMAQNDENGQIWPNGQNPVQKNDLVSAHTLATGQQNLMHFCVDYNQF